MLCALTKDLDYSAIMCQHNPPAVHEVLSRWEIDAGSISELHGRVALLYCTFSLKLTNQLSFLPESLFHSLVFLIGTYSLITVMAAVLLLVLKMLAMREKGCRIGHNLLMRCGNHIFAERILSGNVYQ